jgi:hypothetical protein
MSLYYFKRVSGPRLCGSLHKLIGESSAHCTTKNEDQHTDLCTIATEGQRERTSFDERIQVPIVVQLRDKVL